MTAHDERRGALTVAADFGALLAQHRMAAGLTATELAAIADCHQTYIGQIERGIKTPSREAVLALAEALDATVSQTDRLLFAAGYAPRTDYQALYETKRSLPIDRQERWCRQCRLALERSAFGRDTSKSDGLRNICKRCDAVRMAQYRNRAESRQARRSA